MESKELKKARVAYSRALTKYHAKQDKLKVEHEKLKAEVGKALGDIYIAERRIRELEAQGEQG